MDDPTSFYEMPGSLSRVELEQPWSEKLLMHCDSAPRTVPLAAPEHLRNYYKSNENATLRRSAPLSTVNLPQLPRLEVPQSQYSVPKLMSDHSPLTPSPVSPFTPVLDASITQNQNSGSQLYLDPVSLCTSSKQGYLFAHYGSWENHKQLSPTTPSTATSHDLSHATTPFSAHPSSFNPSLHSWPPLESGQMPPTYSQQTHSCFNYNPRMNDPSAVGTISWPDNNCSKPHMYSTSSTELQRHSSTSSFPEMTITYNTTPPAQHGHREQHQGCESQPQSKPVMNQHGLDYSAPPVYTPLAFDQQPPMGHMQQQQQKQQPHLTPAVCQYCGKVFTGKYGPGNCKRHVQQTHETIFDRVKKMCKVCKKTYNRTDAMRKHAWKKHRLEEFRPNKRRRDV